MRTEDATPWQKRGSYKGHSLLASLAFLLASLVRLPGGLRSRRLQALLKTLLVFLRAYDAFLVRLKELRPALASQLESVDNRLVKVHFRGQDDSFLVGVHEHHCD